jgi:hypothetical protein
VFGQGAFAKSTLSSPDAEAVLSRICAGDMTKPPGSVIYMQMIKGVEANPATDDPFYLNAAGNLIRINGLLF